MRADAMKHESAASGPRFDVESSWADIILMKAPYQ